jgi:hypothetical protein
MEKENRPPVRLPMERTGHLSWQHERPATIKLGPTRNQDSSDTTPMGRSTASHYVS